MAWTVYAPTRRGNRGVSRDLARPAVKAWLSKTNLGRDAVNGLHKLEEAVADAANE